MQPLSPYLFTITIEFFSNLMGIEMARGGVIPLFKRVCRSMSHLLYAEDLLVLIKQKKSGLETLMSVFEEFGKWTGHCSNQLKNMIYFSRTCSGKTYACCTGKTNLWFDRGSPMGVLLRG